MARPTKLDAVNEMLLSIAQAPITSLSDPENLNGSVASSVLDRVKTEILSCGYWFNTVRRTLTPDVSGYIPVASDFLQIVKDKTSSIDQPMIAIRGDRLYNMDDDTDVFTLAYEALLSIDLDFEDLPPTFQRWVIDKATVELYRAVRGSGSVSQELISREMESKAMAIAEDTRQNKRNLFHSNYEAAAIAGRRFNPIARY